MAPQRNVPRDLVWGLANGLGLAVGFSIWVAFATAGRGAEIHARYGLTPLQIVFLYAVAGILGGSLLGLLRPYCGSRLGAFLVGAVIGIMSYGVIGITMSGVSAQAFAGALVLGIIVGGGLGVVWRDEARGTQTDATT